MPNVDIHQVISYFRAICNDIESGVEAGNFEASKADISRLKTKFNELLKFCEDNPKEE